MPITLVRPPEDELESGKLIRVPVRITLAIDPAVSARDGSDASGITVVGTDSTGTWWVFEADPFRGQPSDVVKTIVAYAVAYRPEVLSLEVVAAQRLYKDLLLPELERAGVNCGITEYRSDSRASKHTRICALQPLFRQGKIRVRRGLDRLIRELDEYAGPGSLDHDDLIDSLAQHLAITHRPDEVFAKARYEQEVAPSKRGEQARARLDRGDGTWAGG